MKRILVALLFSVNCLANVQPMVAPPEDTCMRLSAGGFFGMSQDKFYAKGGLTDFSGGLNFSHFLESELFYGLSMSTGASSGLGYSQQLFTDVGRSNSGLRIEGEISFGYFPQISHRVNLGPVLKIGYSRQLGDWARVYYDLNRVSFGDMHMKLGLAIGLRINDFASMYWVPSYTLSKIRFFNSDALENSKSEASVSGFELQFGSLFNITNNLGVYIQMVPKFVSFSRANFFFKNEVGFGLSYAL